MKLAFGVWLAFTLSWFGCRAMDYFWPPANPTFNAAFSILMALLVLAAYVEQRLGG